MGKIADTWKKGKTQSEKAWKNLKKAGKVDGDFPTLKEDFQKNLKKLETIASTVEKLKSKLAQEQQKCQGQAIECLKIQKSYKAIVKKTDKQFTGPTSRGNAQGAMLAALSTVKTEIAEIVSEAIGET